MSQKNNHKQLETMRHSCSHLLAAAVQKLYPNAKFGIGPAIETGFYYDIDFDQDFAEEDLPEIEKEMEKIKAENHKFVRKEISTEKARELFKDNPYKLELINELAAPGRVKKEVACHSGPDPESKKENAVSRDPDFRQDDKEDSDSKQTISIYRTGDFTDLCRGPHVKSTKEIGAFKLLTVAGAYWRGEENNPMLTRIYGTCFETEEQLEQFLKMRKEAEKRDHRKLGKELDLFSFHPESPGSAFWHDNGYTIMKELLKYWREIHKRENYREVRTPVMLDKETWARSGHTKNYLHKMYKVTTPDAEQWDMAVKPMNCNGGILIYKTQLRSYKDFPLRMGELGVVHRYEASGEVSGLLRAREFTQDDAHIYCTPGQVKEELKKVIELCFEVYQTFGLELDHLELSTRPENSIGSDEVWERAESIMREVLSEEAIPHQIKDGEGAFYGPKFDFHLRDAIGRTWQCATIQLDFAQPENFDLEYVTEEGERERPVMIHRVLYGSVERFLGILIEHYGGAFPAWLAPVQTVVIPVSEKQNQYAAKIRTTLKSQIPNIRVEVDSSDNTLNKKIRNAQQQKVPYMLIVGERENTAGDEVSVRLRTEENLGTTKVEKFAKTISPIINKKETKIWPTHKSQDQDPSLLANKP